MRGMQIYMHLSQVKDVRKTYVNETWVLRAINESKLLFVLLMIESNISDKVKPLHPLAQSLLREFEDVFFNDISLRLPPLRGTEH